jgi:E3 Ubiquitin ligase
MSSNVAIDYYLPLALCAGASLGGLWYGVRAWHAGRDIEDTPTSKVRSAAQGYVELVGRSGLPRNATCVAPLSGVPCAWWSYTIERHSGGRRGSWSKVQSGCSEIPFFLDDGTGRCLIDPRGAEVFPSSTETWRGDAGWPASRAGLSGLGGLFPSIFGGEYRYTEHRLYLGEPIYAIGQFRSLGGIVVDESPNALAELLRKWKQDPANLLRRFDANGDGVLDPTEWERARAAARTTLDAEREAKPIAEETNLLAKPADGRSFLLAAGEADTLSRRFRWRTAGGFTVFVAAAALFTWVALHLKPQP